MARHRVALALSIWRCASRRDQCHLVYLQSQKYDRSIGHVTARHRVGPHPSGCRHRYLVLESALVILSVSEKILHSQQVAQGDRRSVVVGDVVVGHSRSRDGSRARATRPLRRSYRAFWTCILLLGSETLFR